MARIRRRVRARRDGSLKTEAVMISVAQYRAENPERVRMIEAAAAKIVSEGKSVSFEALVAALPSDFELSRDQRGEPWRHIVNSEQGVTGALAATESPDAMDNADPDALRERVRQLEQKCADRRVTIHKLRDARQTSRAAFGKAL